MWILYLKSWSLKNLMRKVWVHCEIRFRYLVKYDFETLLRYLMSDQIDVVFFSTTKPFLAKVSI